MVALLPLGLALRDMLIAGGIGLLLAVGYCVFRLLLGTSRTVVFFCDVTVFAVGAVLYRAAVMGAFAGGVMRWYTLAAAALCYGAFVQRFLKISQRAGAFARHTAVAPLLFIFSKVRTALAKQKEKTGAARKKRRAAHSVARLKKQREMPLDKKKDLQKTGTVLYNSQ